MKKLILFIVLLLVVVLLGKNLWPGKQMFDFHDQTQAPRLSEFVLNLKNNIIPPRMAPNFSFKLGYPVFNFYAPTAYWISAAINIFGFDIADSIKLSFLLALLVAFVAMYKYLRAFFNFLPALLGAVLYIASPYLAVDIFVRGNLGEVWFFALLPWSLHLLHKNSSNNSVLLFVITSFIFSATLTVHNVFSLLFLPLAVVYSLLLKKSKRNLGAIFTACLLAAYFLIPAVLELKYTRASQIARTTAFQDHFLCWWQIWKTKIWGYGGSVPGCEFDGMSFKLGKIQLLLSLFGAIVLLKKLIFHKHSYKKHKPHLFILFLTLASLFLSTYSSVFVWQKLTFLSLFQFPWRFLLLALFGTAFFAAYFCAAINSALLKPVILTILFAALLVNAKYFKGATINKQNFLNNYLSEFYITQHAVYKIPEYLPKQVNYKYWLSLDKKISFAPAFSLDGQKIEIIKNDYFEKVLQTRSQNTVINLHYFPYWGIYLNDKPYRPSYFDKLGRVLIKTNDQTAKKITVKYTETPLEKTANIITVITALLLFAFLTKKKLWKKVVKIIS